VRVERRDFLRTLRLSGTVEAVQSFIVSVPRLSGQSGYTLLITRLTPNGARVKPGDILVEFDRQNQVKTALDREAEYRDLEELIQRRQAEQVAAQAQDETELKSAEYDLQAALVDMRKNEVVSSLERKGTVRISPRPKPD